jgi:hypothetical protein
MRFDARTASRLNAGEHLTFDGFPGLGLQVTHSRKSWTFRYKSPLDQRMRQIKLGEWPAMGFPAAIAEWEKRRASRDGGADPAAAKRQSRQTALGTAVSMSGYTVRDLCRDYLTGHIEPHRKSKGANEVRRMFDGMLGSIAGLPADSIIRSQAFDLFESLRGTPMLAVRLRGELGGAWDYALDAGRISPTTPNWWRLVMHGRLRSKGRTIDGVSAGTKKRTLSDDELGILIRWLSNLSLTVADGLTLYLWTGTRGGEIVSMETSEKTEEADGLWWTIAKHNTKNARWDKATDLRVPLIGRAEQVVRRRAELVQHPSNIFNNCLAANKVAGA